MDYARQFVFASNPLRLSAGQWAAAVFVLAVAMAAAPPLAARREPFDPEPEYRLPYEFSEDYWHLTRWVAEAVRRGSVLVLGDSVVWGEYVGPGDALSAHLNRLSGGGRFANLGVNGLHPAALAGLLDRVGDSVRDRDVVLVLNLLWLSSARHDLRQAPGAGEEAQASLNHPALLPQFWPPVPRYRARFEERVSNLMAREIPFLCWVRHLYAVGAQARKPPPAEAEDAGEPRIDDPTPASWRGLFAGVPPPAPAPHGQPVTWEARGIPVSRVDWPRVEESLQWRFARRAVRLLRSRGNRVCVVIAPFNPYVQDAASRARYAELAGQIADQLRGESGVTVIQSEPLPGTEYADASHPLAAGYERWARELAADPRFGPWLAAGGAAQRVRQ